MGRLFVITLEGNIYSCKHCQTHLALSEDILSEAFRCRHGKAYLVDKEAAREKGQKYKEGKFILERFKILGPDGSNYSVSQESLVGGSDADDV